MINKHIWSLAAVMLCLMGSFAFAKSEWNEEKGGNFIIYYRDVPADFVRTVMEEAEAYYRIVSENLGIHHYSSGVKGRRISIYIYRDRNDYVQNGGQAGWSHGVAMYMSKTIHTYPADNGFFDSLLPHELGHILLHEFLGPSADVPPWFDEGVAMYQEKARRLGAHETVRQAIKNGQFIPLTQLADMRLYKDTDEATVLLYYAEAASAVNYMITQLGEEHFYRLCRTLKKETRFKDALQEVYTRIHNLGVLNTQWKRYLEEQ